VFGRSLGKGESRLLRAIEPEERARTHEEATQNHAAWRGLAVQHGPQPSDRNHECALREHPESPTLQERGFHGCTIH
jgi:hypothetical protein